MEFQEHWDWATSLVAFSLLAVFGIYVTNSRWRARTRGCPLPPGPKPLPILGNILDMPKVRPWIGLRDLCSQYGDVLHLRMMNHSHLILGSAEVIFEIMNKRSANNSDRPRTITSRLTGIDRSMGLLPYGQEWKQHRSAFWQHFRPEVCMQYRPTQEAITRKFLAKLLLDPSNLQQLIRFTFSATLLRILYGIDVEDENDAIILMIDTAVEASGQSLVPGKFLMDSIPLLRHVLPWVPGTGFQKQFAEWKAELLRLEHIPFAQYKNKPSDCVVNSLLSRLTPAAEGLSLTLTAEALVKNVASAAFLAGSDTSYSTMQATFLAMSLYRDSQKRAQDELDTVVGPDRLPDFRDYGELIYVKAIIKESLRWFNVVPLGLSHQTMKDDEYRGYFIPAGTILTANIWACLHDPDKYQDPDRFLPDRFIKDGKLDPNVRDPYDFVFGSGRRICPGRHFAEAALFINIACVLHVFDISPPLDDTGEPIVIKPQMTDNVLSYPEDGRCTIKPRAAAAAALIHAAQVENVE